LFVIPTLIFSARGFGLPPPIAVILHSCIRIILFSSRVCAPGIGIPWVCTGWTRTGLCSVIARVLGGPALVAFHKCWLEVTKTVKYILPILPNFKVSAMSYQIRPALIYKIIEPSEQHWEIERGFNCTSRTDVEPHTFIQSEKHDGHK
jgi:hypothetical protein